MPPRELTYEDLLQIVELIKTASHFSEFRLKVGDIEVMKLMNSVTAGVEGEVAGIYVENAQGVEPGQALIAVRKG